MRTPSDSGPMPQFSRFLALCIVSAASAGAQATSQKPTLVVMITIDGFREGNLDRFGPQLHGGLGRLMNGGAWFTNAHHDHAITETAPGHATLLSGRFPRSTGITANRAGVLDPASPLLGFSGGPGASPTRFQGTELFDWLYARIQNRELSRFHRKIAVQFSQSVSRSSKSTGTLPPMENSRRAATTLTRFLTG